MSKVYGSILIAWPSGRQGVEVERERERELHQLQPARADVRQRRESVIISRHSASKCTTGSMSSCHMD